MAIRSRLKRLENRFGPTKIVCVLQAKPGWSLDEFALDCCIDLRYGPKLTDTMTGKNVYDVDSEASWINDGKLYINFDRISLVKIYSGYLFDMIMNAGKDNV